MMAPAGKTRRAATLAGAYEAAGLHDHPRRRGHRAFVRRLAARGITTVPDLTASFDELPKQTQRAALDLLSVLEDRRAVPLLIRLFDAARFCPTACMALGFTGGRRALRHLMGVVESELARPHRDRDLGRFECALYGLETMEESALATDLFLRVARCRQLPVHLRATAVRALGMAAEEAARPLSDHPAVASLILESLDDPSPTIRLSAIEAAALMGLRAACARLEEIARTDPAKVRGEGSLARRSREALAELTG